MTTTNTTAAIESLRTLASVQATSAAMRGQDNAQLTAFVRMCDAALHRDQRSWDAAHDRAAKATGHARGCLGTCCALIREESVYADDAWAVERVMGAIRRADYIYSTDATVLRIIQSTDCTRPDELIARTLRQP